MAESGRPKTRRSAVKSNLHTEGHRFEPCIAHQFLVSIWTQKNPRISAEGPFDANVTASKVREVTFTRPPAAAVRLTLSLDRVLSLNGRALYAFQCFQRFGTPKRVGATKEDSDVIADSADGSATRPQVGGMWHHKEGLRVHIDFGVNLVYGPD
jgi:hypothetical protein